MSAWWIALIVFLTLESAAMLAYLVSRNRLVTARARVDLAWAGIEAQRGRRDALDAGGRGAGDGEGATPARREEAEDRLAAARRLYAASAQDYNARLASFPGSFIGARAGMVPARMEPED